VRHLRLLAFMMVLAPFAPEAYACSCTTRDGPKGEFKAARAVFVGRVISYDGEKARFAVVRAFKNAERREISVASSPYGEACGYGLALRAGSEHLIYAFGPTEDIETGTCTRTGPAAERACDRKYLIRRAWWWSNPLSSIRLMKWLGIRWKSCGRP
jgi:hypothetical protein